MYIIKRSLIILSLFLFWENGQSQQTGEFNNPIWEYQKAVDLFEAQNFGLAMDQFDQAISRLYQVNEEESDHLLAKAKLYKAHCAINLELPDAEKQMTNFISDHRPNPLINEAYFVLGNYYYSKKKYDKLIYYFSEINRENILRSQASEVNFKLAYGYFVTKKFDNSKALFKENLTIRDQYQEPSNYYYAVCLYFEKEYAQAVERFHKIENSSVYRPFIPYYITQIYFVEGELDKVVEYGESIINEKRIRNIKEIRHLIGQAYYQKEDYENAIGHLEYFEEHSDKLKKEDFYQLAFTQYKLGRCNKAIDNLKELSNSDDEMGQNSNYYLADCLLKEGDKLSAKNAFRRVSTMNYNADMKDEALFNYGKLSAELGYDNESIGALRDINKGSKYYDEAQLVLSNVLLNTRDFTQAIKILESMPEKSLKLKEAYQRVCLYRGIQLMNEEKVPSALQNLQKSLKDPVDLNAEAQAIFLLGDLTHKRAKYDESMALLAKYFRLSSKIEDLPSYSSPALANYIQGYNYLKKQDYKNAKTYFVNTVNELASTGKDIKENNRVLGDSYLRAGDCFVKINSYTNAIKYYDGVIVNKYPGFTYALFQKAIILGLQDKPFEKLLALEELYKNYKKSEYADDALLEAGDSYLSMQNNKEALEVLNTLLRDYTKSNLINKARLKIGLITYNQGDVKSALNTYKSIFNNNPNAKEASEALLALEEIYIDDLQDPDAYFAFVEKLPGYNVSDVSKDSLNYRVAFAQYENGNYAEAADRFTDYLIKYPNGRYNLEAQFNRAESNTLIERYSEAAKDYKAIADKGQSVYQINALKKAAVIYYNHEQDFKEAYKLYDQLSQLAESDDLKLEAELGAMRSGYRSGKIEEATSYALKVEAKPGVPKDDILLVHFLIGKKGMKDELYDEALISFTIVAKYEGTNQAAEAIYRIAQIYFLRDDLPTSETKAKEGISASSNYPYWVAKNIILIADISIKKNDLFNARAALEAVIDNYKDDENIIAEATQKLEKVKELEAKQNRIQEENKDGSLKMQLIDNGNNN